MTFTCCSWWLVAGLFGGTLLSWLVHELLARQEDVPGEPPLHVGRRTNGKGDQLEAIEGIGPKIAAVFRARDIRTFGDVAAKSPHELRRILDDAGHRFDLAHTDTWPHQARLLADGDVLAFVALTQRLKGGVEPATR